ncbi:MAG: GHMP kinase [Methylophilus sp.]|nr:GHMP kinase [Methylophilus sp.]
MQTHLQHRQIEVITSARLHMGFFDLNGSIGRRYGSIGLSLNSPQTHIVVSEGIGPVAPDYVERSKRVLLQHFGIQSPVSVDIIEEIPRHAGLGSGTQMALAIGVAICELFDLKLSLREIAQFIGRGARSGIGIGTFAAGGVVLDGGVNSGKQVPPIIAQHHFPEAWRILLIFDHQYVGVHGSEEQQAFKVLSDRCLASTQQLSHLLLMEALPALVEQDLNAFGKAISALQAYNGDYFAPVQGGRYASRLVSDVLNDLHAHGIQCVGQSSWGPTGFAIFADQATAESHMRRLQAQFDQAQLGWQLCTANNRGASINIRNKGELIG